MSYVFDYPIADAWSTIQPVDTINRGLLLDGYWEKSGIGFYLIIYDLSSNKLVKYLDSTVKPHVKTESSTGQNHVIMYDALPEKEVQVSKILNTGDNIYFNSKIERKDQLNQASNFDLMYFHEKQLTPGSLISIEHNSIQPLTSESTIDIRSKLMGESEELIELAEINMPIFEMPLPDVERISFDIEVASPRGIFPVPEEARFRVNAIATYDSTDHASVWILGFSPTTTELKEIENNLGYLPEVRHFLDERRLLKDFFNEIINHQIILSYNGDNFDLPYLLNRGRKLGLDVPIYEGFKHGFYHKKQYHFVGTIHLDLFRFFANNSVRLYAFGGKYSRLRLDDVAEALLGEKKVEHNLWFDEMTRGQMVEYNAKDVELTLRLTTFSDNLTWAVMLMIMRVGKMTLTQVNRASISNWILNWLAFEHARKGWILPSREALNKKGFFDSSAEIDGKGYQGAIVFEPDPGVYWDVTVADYASLYPSVIKKYRLSYETVRCPHDSCKSNQVPELTHWVCSKMGIMSALVGYVRDIRVNYYKQLAKFGETEADRLLGSTIQAALKVFINASYGVFGNRSFALFCPPVAESTTAYSRHALLEAKRIANEMGYTVLYGDTDSIFVHKLTDKDFRFLQAWSIVELGIELGIDYRFRYLVLSGRKKNYFGIKMNSDTIIKGLQVKKSNTSIFIKELFQDILDVLRQVDTPAELKQGIKRMITKIRLTRKKLRSGKIPIEKLAKMSTLTKAFDEYQTKTPAVQVAIQEMTEENQDEYVQGVQFMVVPCKPKDAVVRTTRFKEFPPGYVMKCNYQSVDKIDPYSINWNKFETELENAFEPIFDAFGLKWAEELDQTTSLDVWF